jgi:hypothetical protein
LTERERAGRLPTSGDNRRINALQSPLASQLAPLWVLRAVLASSESVAEHACFGLQEHMQDLLTRVD